jgi:hypothetical protein
MKSLHIITEGSNQYQLGEIKENHLLYDFKKIYMYWIATNFKKGINLSKYIYLKMAYLNFRIAFNKFLAKWKQEQSVSETA